MADIAPPALLQQLVLWQNDHLVVSPELSSLVVDGVSEHQPLAPIVMFGPPHTGKQLLVSRLHHLRQEALLPCILSSGLWLVSSPPRAWTDVRQNQTARVMILVVLAPEMLEDCPTPLAEAAKQHLLALACMVSSQLLFNIGDTLSSTAASNLLLALVKASKALHARKSTSTQLPQLLVLYRDVKPAPGACGKLLPRGETASAVLEQELFSWAHRQAAATLHQAAAAAAGRQASTSGSGPTSVTQPCTSQSINQQFVERNAVLFPSSGIVSYVPQQKSSFDIEQSAANRPFSRLGMSMSANMASQRPANSNLYSTQSEDNQTSRPVPLSPLPADFQASLTELTSLLHPQHAKQVQGQQLTLQLIKVLINAYIGAISTPTMVQAPAPAANDSPAHTPGGGSEPLAMPGAGSSNHVQTQGALVSPPTAPLGSRTGHASFRVSASRLVGSTSVVPSNTSGVGARMASPTPTPPAVPVPVPALQVVWDHSLLFQCQGNAEACLQQFMARMAGVAAGRDEQAVLQVQAEAWEHTRERYLNHTTQADGYQAAGGLRQLRQQCEAHCQEVMDRVQASIRIKGPKRQLGKRATHAGDVAPTTTSDSDSFRRHTSSGACLPDVPPRCSSQCSMRASVAGGPVEANKGSRLPGEYTPSAPGLTTRAQLPPMSHLPMFQARSTGSSTGIATTRSNPTPLRPAGSLTTIGDPRQPDPRCLQNTDDGSLPTLLRSSLDLRGQPNIGGSRSSPFARSGTDLPAVRATVDGSPLRPQQFVSTWSGVSRLDATTSVDATSTAKHPSAAAAWAMSFGLPAPVRVATSQSGISLTGRDSRLAASQPSMSLLGRDNRLAASQPSTSLLGRSKGTVAAGSQLGLEMPQTSAHMSALVSVWPSDGGNGKSTGSHRSQSSSNLPLLQRPSVTFNLPDADDA